MTRLVVPANIDKYERIYRQGYDKKYPNLDLVRLEGWYFNKKPGRLLDYGAGTGVNALHMAECGYNVVAVDAAKESVALMKSKLKNMAAAQWVSPDATALPFEDDGFDYIVCMSVLSLLETKERISTLVDEFFRVLKPGGKMIADINGPDSGFASKGTFVDEDTFEYTLRPDHDQPLRCYCPKTKEAFAKLFSDFIIDDLGHVSFRYSGQDSYEFIACVSKAT